MCWHEDLGKFPNCLNSMSNENLVLKKENEQNFFASVYVQKNVYQCLKIAVQGLKSQFWPFLHSKSTFNLLQLFLAVAIRLCHLYQLKKHKKLLLMVFLGWANCRGKQELEPFLFRGENSSSKCPDGMKVLAFSLCYILE